MFVHLLLLLLIIDGIQLWCVCVLCVEGFTGNRNICWHFCLLNWEQGTATQCDLSCGFFPLNIVKCSICCENVCRSVSHTRKSRLNGSRYQNILACHRTMEWWIMFHVAKFAALNSGVYHKGVHWRQRPPADGENWTNNLQYLGNHAW